MTTAQRIPRSDRSMKPQLPDNSIAVVLGTRPEIVKLAGIIQLLGRAARIVHTGQHFDKELSQIFFDTFALPEPTVHLAVGGVDRAAQIAGALQALAGHIAAAPPLAVVVQGDTNSTAAGAIAANAAEIPLVHVEAGLRSFDRRMPEEHNRVIADHLADLCLAPTEVNQANLAAEGIEGHRVVVTGNTVVEAVATLLPTAQERGDVLAAHGVEAGRYALATIHRPENVDEPDVLAAIVHELAEIDLPVIFPLHPRTAARLDGNAAATLRTTAPLGYAEFLALAAESAMIISDSGGIQEEASIIKRPVLVVRRSTERPEVLGTFAERVLPGPDISRTVAGWLADIDGLHDRLAALPSPYGDGTASQQSIDAINALLG
jgi:UDP-N-acetylglucosamine 2-epimerase (non-hydrolysing)